MSGTPAISVVMSVYNGARYLHPAVESILEQDFADFEFIIVDDGSTDGSGAILLEFAEKDARIRLIQRENRGLVASLNEAIALARAPLIARMDCDDIAMPDRFTRQIEYLADHPEIAIVGSHIHEIDEDGAIVA